MVTERKRRKRVRTWSLLALKLLFLVAATEASASVDSSFVRAAFQKANSAIGTRVANYTLIDHRGDRLKVSQFRGRPVVLSFIYTECANTCAAITMAIERALKRAPAEVLDNTVVLTFGFDAERDTPERLKEYGSPFMKRFKNWLFVTADADTIKRFTDQTGFWFQKRRDGGFDHLNMITIIDGDGRIYSHIYGVDFGAEELLEPLTALINRKDAEKPSGSEGLVDLVKLLCYSYDEATGTYRPDYTFLMTVGMWILVQVVGVGFVIYLFKGRRDATKTDKG